MPSDISNGSPTIKGVQKTHNAVFIIKWTCFYNRTDKNFDETTSHCVNDYTDQNANIRIWKKTCKNARPISPADKISDATTLFRYPILSTYFAQNKSISSCVKKNAVEIKAIFPSEI